MRFTDLFIQRPVLSIVVSCLLLMLGVQARARQASVFLQGMAWPSNSNFFLYNTHGFNGSLEAGVRINVGSAIADDR